MAQRSRSIFRQGSLRLRGSRCWRTVRRHESELSRRTGLVPSPVADKFVWRTGAGPQRLKAGVLGRYGTTEEAAKRMQSAEEERPQGLKPALISGGIARP